MAKDPRWRQPTPDMQLTVILMSMEGHVSNAKQGLCSGPFPNIMEEHYQQLKALQPYLKDPSKWVEEDESGP